MRSLWSDSGKFLFRQGVCYDRAPRFSLLLFLSGPPWPLILWRFGSRKLTRKLTPLVWKLISSMESTARALSPPAPSPLTFGYLSGITSLSDYCTIFGYKKGYPLQHENIHNILGIYACTNYSSYKLRPAFATPCLNSYHLTSQPYPLSNPCPLLKPEPSSLVGYIIAVMGVEEDRSYGYIMETWTMTGLDDIITVWRVGPIHPRVFLEQL